MKQIALTDNVLVEIKDAETGLLLEERRERNRIVSTGRDVVRDLLSNVDWAPNYLAIGTGATAAVDGDVQLETEVFRNAFTRTIPSASKVSFQLYILATQANGNTVNEIGLFRGAKRSYVTDPSGVPLTGGTLFARAIISPFEKTIDITVTITWDINLQSAS